MPTNTHTPCRVIAALTIMCCWGANGSAAVFHVAPQGSDSAPGSVDQPFATLARAQAAARQLAPGTSRRILVRAGIYFDTALQLGPEDSGLVIEGSSKEPPILYGGCRVSGWAPEQDPCFAAALPPRAPGGEWQVRLLQVNGHLRPRSRFPSQGTFKHRSQFNVPWMSTTGGGWKRPPTVDELSTLLYAPEDIDHSLEVANAEVTVFHMWDESCVGLAAQDPLKHILRLSPPAGHPPGAFGVQKYVLWNTREGLTQPGNWYHDRLRNRIVYWPLPGENMSTAEVIAPTTTVILDLRGRPGAKVRDVSIRHLTLAVTTVPLIAAGFAAEKFDGAVSLRNTENCLLSDLRITRIAGHGISQRTPDRGTRIENCEVAESGAGGIYVGGSQCVISNNHVHAIGLSYPSAVGIYRSGSGNRISHNEVHACPYSAISYGGRSNIIEHNLLYDCMKVLHDGAAIYVFAGQGCILRNNLARDIADTGGYGASAYYLDERSSGCVVEHNVAVGVNWPSHNHMASNNVIRQNLFLAPGDAKLTFPRSSGFTFEKNVLQAGGGIQVQNPAAVSLWTNNVFHSRTGQVRSVLLDRYSPAKTLDSAPPGTLLADPRLLNPAPGKYHFGPGSPAARLGIEPLDLSTAGPVHAGRPASN